MTYIAHTHVCLYIILLAKFYLKVLYRSLFMLIWLYLVLNLLSPIENDCGTNKRRAKKGDTCVKDDDKRGQHGRSHDKVW